MTDISKARVTPGWNPDDEPVYPVEILVPSSLFHRLERQAEENGRSIEDEALITLNGAVDE